MSKSTQQGQLEEQPNFSSLPDEMISKVFSHLDITDFLQSVRSVDRRFRRLCGDSVTEIDMRRTPLLKPSRFIQLLPLFPRLRSLQIYHWDWQSEAHGWNGMAIEALRWCPLLESLCTNCRDSADLFDAIEEHGKSLRRISLTGAPNLDPTSFSKLTHIELHYCDGLNDGVLLSIGSECKSLESFTCIESSRGMVSDEAIATFLGFVKASLKAFSWSMSYKREDTWISHLSGCQRLEEVKFRSLQSHHMLGSILEAAGRLPSLKHLTLDTSRIDDAAVFLPDKKSILMSDKMTTLTLENVLLYGSSLVWFTENVQFPGLLRFDLLDGLVTDTVLRRLADWCGQTLERISLMGQWTGCAKSVLSELVRTDKWPRLKWIKIHQWLVGGPDFAIEMRQLGVEVVQLR